MRIESHLDSLKLASWMSPARQRWPNFVFFFADLPNALRILHEGKLVCRSQAQMAVDTGSEAVLGLTADQWKDCVRLYFRPRTPTQHQIEGFRPSNQYGSLGKHTPVPIFFLFDAKDILTRKTTRFSKGNLSQNPPVGEDAAFFESIPFEKVYHDSWMKEEEKTEIKFHRHAEIIVPRELEFGKPATHLVQIGRGIPDAAALSSTTDQPKIQGDHRPGKAAKHPLLQMDFRRERSLGTKSHDVHFQLEHSYTWPVCRAH